MVADPDPELQIELPKAGAYKAAEARSHRATAVSWVEVAQQIVGVVRVKHINQMHVHHALEAHSEKRI